MSARQVGLRKAFRYAVFFFIIIGVLLAVSNFQKFKSNFQSLDILFLAAAAGCALMVHFLEGLFLHYSLRVYGERLPLGVSLRYALVINSIGYLVSLGGVTQFATQAHVLDHYGISVRKATILRVLHLLFFNIVFDAVLVAGFAAIVLGAGGGRYLRLIQAVTAFFILIKPGLYLMLFWKGFRDRLVGLLAAGLNRLLGVFTRRARIDPRTITGLFEEFQQGLGMIAHRRLLVVLGLLTLLIWVFWIGSAAMSFAAVDYAVQPGTLAVGFTIGQIVGVLSMIPGGIGTQEGASALAYTALGVPFETALSAVLVYRMAYYVVPFVVGLPFYFSLRRRFHAAGKPSAEGDSPH
jgi:uncharacterized protein (TIRG00374 family)